MKRKKEPEFQYVQQEENQSFKWLHIKTAQDFFFWHYHPEYEIVYVVGGSGRQYVGEHRSFYDDGTLVLIGSNVPHLNFSYGRTDNIEEVVIQISVAFVDAFCKNVAEAKNIAALFEKCRRGLVFDKNIQKEIGEKLKHIGTLEGMARILALLNVLEILANTVTQERNEVEGRKGYQFLNLKNQDFNLPTLEHQRLNKVIEYIESNYANDNNFEEAAALSGLTDSAFSRFFKKYTSSTFTDFLNETRINEARILLSQGKNVSETAFAVGFNHLGHFTEVFKKITNDNPKDFRKKVAR